ISGRGSNMKALLDASARGELPAVQWGVVLSNNPDAAGLDTARNANIETVVVDHRDFRGNRAGHDQAVADALVSRGIEAVVLAGYLRIVGSGLLGAFKGRMINIHPSLLPSFPGLDAQQQALDWGAKVSGCTVHFVDEGVDSGPIILQR